MKPLPIICTCRHTDSEHAPGGPCNAEDSYGRPCECPGLEPSPYDNGTDLPDDVDGERWGPRMGGRRLPQGVGESKSPE